MKIFTNKRKIYKILIVFAAILILSILLPNICTAAKGDGGIGGRLFQPILDFFVGIADWIMSFIQKSIFGIEETFIHIDRANSLWSIFWSVIITIVVVAGCIALTVITAGAGTGVGAVAIITALAHAAKGIIIVGTLTFIGAKYLTSKNLPDDFYLPVIELTPESIFSR